MKRRNEIMKMNKRFENGKSEQKAKRLENKIGNKLREHKSRTRNERSEDQNENEKI